MIVNDRKSTRQRILEAAEIEFLDKGLDAAKTADIANRAGVNHAMLHYYFSTKENLFDDVFFKKIKFFSRIALLTPDSDTPFLERLEKTIQDHFEILRQNPKLTFFLVRELGSNPERLERMKKKMSAVPKMVIDKFKKEVEEEIRKGNIRKIDPNDLIINILALNAFMFVAKPMVLAVTQVPETGYDDLLEHRKKETAAFIVNSLRP